jgi:hypothetical protein
MSLKKSSTTWFRRTERERRIGGVGIHTNRADPAEQRARGRLTRIGFQEAYGGFLCSSWLVPTATSSIRHVAPSSAPMAFSIPIRGDPRRSAQDTASASASPAETPYCCKYVYSLLFSASRFLCFTFDLNGSLVITPQVPNNCYSYFGFSAPRFHLSLSNHRWLVRIHTQN